MNAGKEKMMRLLLMVTIAMSLLLAGCKAGTATEVQEQEKTEFVDATETEAPVEDEAGDEPTSFPIVEDPGINPLPADPISETFSTGEGIELAGTFYPAATTDAPLLVLMHWGAGRPDELGGDRGLAAEPGTSAGFGRGRAALAGFKLVPRASGRCLFQCVHLHLPGL